MNELQWIDYLRRKAKLAKNLAVGIGDDCAVVKVAKENLLLKSDLFIEGVHFKLKNISFENIGRRATARVLSDFAACGGVPKFIGVSLGASRGLDKRYLKQILRGVLKLAKKYKFSLVGGDTCTSDQLILDVWGIGNCRKPILRSTAKVGDYIFVTNRLGTRPFNKPFEPRIKEAQYLVKNFKVNSMIDISDGLILDLYRILKLSKKGAVIEREALPLTRGVNDLYRGEDYELIFTVDKRELKINLLRSKFYCIGRITPKNSGYKLKDKGKLSRVKVKGYSQF